MAKAKALSKYAKRRDFKKSPEPKPKIAKTSSKKKIFVVQKHYATHLHYDLRLEISGTLKSWAIPKGPSTKVGEKRLAILTEDHPKKYASFEGTIPEGQYGAGKVIIWDKGSYENIKTDKTGKEVGMRTCFDEGRIEVSFSGKKLKGAYALIAFREKNWLLIKMKKR